MITFILVVIILIKVSDIQSKLDEIRRRIDDWEDND